MKDLESTAQRLRWAREQAGLSQGQVARMLGLHRPTISQIEAGKRDIKSHEVAQFADLYEVKDDWLIRGAEAITDDVDPRVEVAARELKKLRSQDLDKIMDLIRVLRTNEEGGRG